MGIDICIGNHCVGVYRKLNPKPIWFWIRILSVVIVILLLLILFVPDLTERIKNALLKRPTEDCSTDNVSNKNNIERREDNCLEKSNKKQNRLVDYENEYISEENNFDSDENGQQKPSGDIEKRKRCTGTVYTKRSAAPLNIQIFF
ncbi:uncharacterized protein LOC128999288 [Macrosteles quadrilineatus]|uniref:uncharacterized protein LOC128999288 n=1 Tax=Macrosteles quadrilineatus TaxID=74068 RepID=UPI0023E2ADC0|nr:uncharacterized protein LOC128999288 [Macrosteles quadrilineatus]